jgi:hypothetical protein
MNGVLTAVGTISNSVATTAGIVYSVNNGVSWTQRSLPVSDIWVGGAYISNKYVVVGRSNAPHSTDLISWTNVTLPDLGAVGGLENYWSNVEEVNGRLYAYRSTGGIYTDNGTTWSEITFPFSIRDIVYANNKYTITGTNAVASSTDGLTNWVTQSMPSNGSWVPIEHANGTYVIFKESSTAAAYSTDAITWTEVGHGSIGYSFDDVEYINGRFIALPANGIDLVYSSTNGVTWTSYAKGLAEGQGFNSLLTMTDTTYVSGLELGFLDGTTSPVQSQLDAKAPLVSPTFTGTVTLPTGSVTSTMIQDGTIVNADINSSAAIALSKLANGTSGQIIVANASGVPTWVSETGDVTISDTGVTAIASGVIVDADVNASAAIAQSKISGLATDLAAKAPLASPALTGVPTAPTATAGTNTTQVATTAFVGTAVSNLVASAPAALDTLNELATALGNDASFSTTVSTSIGSKIAKSDITAKGAILVGTGSGTYTSQTVGTNGQVLTANSAQADGVEWTTISGYSAPTLGATSISSGATVTTIAGLTLTSPTINTPTLTLSTTASTSQGRFAWDQTNSQLDIGDGTTIRTITADNAIATLTNKTLSGATLTGTLTAGGGTGTSGQVLASTGTGTQWVAAPAPTFHPVFAMV